MKVNEPSVVFQVFGDEIVIINMAVGSYYSVRKVGADIFNLMASGATPNAIQSILVSRWEGVSPRILLVETVTFIDSLLKEGLLVEGDSTAEALVLPAYDPRQAYETPVLNTYSDMQALLLLDPIHDVDELGWPNKAT